MIRPRLSYVLLLNAGAALAVVACGQPADDSKGTGGTGAGATGGANAAGAAGGAGGASGGSAAGAGKGTGATGGTTGGAVGAGGATGGAGGTGGTTGGAGGATGGGAGTGMTVGGAGGAPGGAGGTTGGGAGMGAGGTTPMGGAGGTTAGSAGMGAGGTSPVTCTITPTATQSEVISTVFNVSYTTDLPSPDSAHIDFGPDTNYGFTAPVDLADAKTPLLGMKPMKDYHYRVVVGSGANTCTGTDQTITTGPVANGLPKPMITTVDATALQGGFMLSEWYAGKQLAFILDKDNDIVWWFDPKTVNAQFGDLTRARMTYDGKSMYIAHGNVPSQTGRMVKVSMDGTGATDLSSNFTGLNHDFTILPDESVYFIAYSSGSCDDIKLYKGGTTTTVMNMSTAFSSGACHSNAIEYSKEDDTLVVSELDHNAYVKMKRTGEVVWVLGGGSDNDFTGDASTWSVEHNLEMLGANHMLMFNNASAPGGSNAIELTLDPTAKTATRNWVYTASPAINNAVMGDVQRLPNGNTLVTYSTQGIVQEVDANKKLLQSLSWGTGGALGYVVKRPTLYGPSPK